MPRKIIYLLLTVGLFAFLSCEKNESLKIISTSIDNLDVSTGVNPESFLFSWKMSSVEKNVKQVSYQILVSDKDDFLKENLIWDSGIVKSDQSILLEYEGAKLKSGQNYFWKVKVWDNHNNESGWSEINSFTTGLFSPEEWSGAKWIAYEQLPDSNRLVEGVTGYGDLSLNKVEKRSVVPMFRSEFILDSEVESATLFISGIGQYEASLNGEKVGNDFLTPGWTHYDKTILYNTYDVTDKLMNGDNAIGVIVGNGFLYNNRERYRKLIIAYGFPQMICKLQVQYKNGETATIVSDSNWKMKPSPITYSGIYGGEDYDATRFEKGWDKAGFNAAGWVNAKLVNHLAGTLKPDRNNPVRVMQQFDPVKVTQLNDSVYMYDFGQNASGIVSLKVKGEKGGKIQLRPGEVLDENGFVSQRGSGSPYYFNYTVSGDGEESWQPRFSYYGFRYVQVTGAKPADFEITNSLPEIIEMKSLHTRSSAPQVGTFECSNELFNQTFNLINWGIKSNIQNVMTDCPTREKLGWLEQTHLVGASIHYNFDMYNLYSKLIEDMMDAVTEEGLVPNIVPEYINFEYYDAAFRDSPEWGSAAILQPWLVYKWYGDFSKIEEAWPMMQQYFEYLKNKSTNHILSHGLGDWYDVGPDTPGYAQLTPVPLVATAMYYYDAVLMGRIAETLHKNTEADSYRRLAVKIKEAFNKEFYNDEMNTYATGSQTSMAMPLSMGLVSEENVKSVLENLVKVINENDNRITAGDVGFHFLVDALTKYGEAELLYTMNNRDDVPGYGYQLKKGATSLAESWQALETKSLNHLMLGHIMEWFYGGLAGIGQAESSVAYKQVKIEPQMVKGISSAKATFESPYGNIVSDWVDSDSLFVINIEIPVNAKAKLILPIDNAAKVFENDIPVSSVSTNSDNGKVHLELGSGIYHFEVKK